MASHSSFYQGTKRISPLKIRNPSILPSQIMPSPTGAPFNFAEMPWTYGVKPGQVMEFNAVIRPSPITIPHGPGSPVPSMPSVGSPPSFGLSPITHSFLPEVRKRKPDPDVIPVPSKQFLTEEVMSSHFNNLHLSTEYTSHNIRTKSATPETTAELSQEADMLLDESNIASDGTKPYHVCMSPKELEERLKKAQRIAICEEVRKLDGRAEILPQSLLERMEKPCTALMIWQPPQERVQSLFSKVSEKLQERESEERKALKNKNNNNNNNNNNDATTVDSMAISDEPLPDLPDYDEDLDFEQDASGTPWQQQSAPDAPDLATMDIEM